MIRVKVKLFATLNKYAPVDGLSGTPFDMDIPDSSTLQDLVVLLKMPEDAVNIAFVNGIIQELDCPLNANDEIGMFSPIGGG
jgi:molybdopterin converting factor small subunit